MKNHKTPSGRGRAGQLLCRGAAAGVAGAVLLAAQMALPRAAQATPEKANALYEDAQQRYDKGDLPGAAIQLKNALREDRKMLAAQLLLGKILLKSGQLAAAEESLEEAQSLGVSPSEVAVPLGQIYLLMGEPKKLLERVKGDGLAGPQLAEVLTLRASAWAMAGDLAQAAKGFADARQQDPRSAAPLIAQAPLLLRTGEPEKARAMALQATQLAPENAAAWSALGMVLQGLKDDTGALKAYDRALALGPSYAEARIARAALLVGMGRDQEAGLDLAKLKAASVVDPRASYMRGLLASRRGDAAAARASYQEAAKLIDTLPPPALAGKDALLLTGALAHRALGDNEKARAFLATLVAREPDSLPGPLLLATICVEAKDYGCAEPLLSRLQQLAPEDPQVLYLAGSVQLARRHYAQASELLEKAITRNAPPAATRELGFSQLGLGQVQPGMEHLEQAFARDAHDTQAGVELAVRYARAGDSAKALRIAQTIVANDPANLVMLNFLGNIKGRAGDKAGARAAFEQVLAKDPGFRPAVINLSWLDIEQGRFNEARQRLTQNLKLLKDDPDLLFELGALEQRAGQPAEALRYWQRADDTQRRDPRAGLAMFELYLGQGRLDKAVETAHQLSARYPGNLVVQLTQARAALAAGDVAGTRLALREATRLAEFDADKQVLVGRMQLAAGNADGAAYNVLKALQARPDDESAMVLQVEVAARRRDNAGVDTALKALATKHPNSAATLLTRANVAMSRGQFAAAQADYRAAMDREPATTTAILLAQAQIAAGEIGKAVDFLAAWAVRRPGDTVALKALAEVQFAAGQTEAARQSYAKALAAAPNDPQTLSSYAALLQALGDPAAVGMAQQALKLAPNDPGYADTLGWILTQRGDFDAGLRYLRDARLRNPGATTIRFHLAYALAKSGRRTEARDELTAALNAPGGIDRNPDVLRLKQELGL